MKPKIFKTINNRVFKQCPKCMLFKDFELDYGNDKSNPRGKTSNCRTCKNSIKQDKERAKLYYRNGGNVKKAQYYQKNKETIHKQRRNRIDNDPILKLSDRIRKSIQKSIKHKAQYKDNRTFEIVGCSKEEFIQHLIKTFENNYKIKYNESYLKDLHIDHIIPISSSNTKEEVLKLNHYTNLQFLYKDHNMEKKVKLNYIIPPYPSKGEK